MNGNVCEEGHILDATTLVYGDRCRKCINEAKAKKLTGNLTDAQLKRLRDAISDGVPWRDLAVRFNTGKEYVAKVAKMAGIKASRGRAGK